MLLTLDPSPLNAAVVTVVVPAYNHACYIIEALDSVRNQTFQHWKMIVIDDGSTDETWSLLCSYQKQVADQRIQILTQENRGSHATINRGMSMASTPYLAILNSDDFFNPNRLEKLVDIASATGGDIFIATGIQLVDETSLPINQEHWWQSMYQNLLNHWYVNQATLADNPAVQSLLWGNFTVSTSNFFMSRSVWQRVGSFKHLRYVPDWEYALRIASTMPEAFHFLPNMVTLSYRLHGHNTILGGALRNHLEALHVLRTFQKMWSATGHLMPVHAIDRLYYLNRFMRHEHTRCLLEGQKKGWVEQVEALRSELDNTLLTQSQWQSQSEHWQSQSEHWQSQSEQWQSQSEQWQQLAQQMRISLSWRLTAPLRQLNSKLTAIRVMTKQWLTRVKRKLTHRSKHLLNPYQLWLKGEAIALTQLKANADIEIANMQSKPFFSIVMPAYDTPSAFLRAAVLSVQSQWYPHWELCISNDASNDPNVRVLIDEFEKTDARIKCIHRQVSGHIVLATNDAIAISKGQYIVFLDHDDLLAPQALFAFAKKLKQTPDADLIYSDEDKIDSRGQRCLPFFKPDWSPVLAWSQNYVGHLMCVRRQLLIEIGSLRPGTQGSQDHDLVLRLALHNAKIVHLPGVLYHWRLHAASTAANPDAKPYAHHAGKDAVACHLTSRYGNQFTHVDDSEYPFVYLPRFVVPQHCLASIIIPTLDKIDLLKPCIDSIRNQTVNVSYEIIILDNGSIEPQTAAYFKTIAGDKNIQIIDAPLPFNWSRLNNIGRRHANGQVLVFLNNDTTVISADWLHRLMEYALLPDVATVGALLLYPDNTIQHAGVVVGMGGWADHVFKGQALINYPSPFVSSMLPRNVLANTGACTAIAAARFDQLGGYDESFQICGSDVELGIRAHKRGYLNVYLPSVRMYHLESKTRTPHVPEVDFQQSDLKYAPYRLEGDPFYNPHLDLFQSSPTPGAYNAVAAQPCQ